MRNYITDPGDTLFPYILSQMLWKVLRRAVSTMALNQNLKQGFFYKHSINYCLKILSPLSPLFFFSPSLSLYVWCCFRFPDPLSKSSDSQLRYNFAAFYHTSCVFSHSYMIEINYESFQKRNTQCLTSVQILDWQWKYGWECIHMPYIEDDDGHYIYSGGPKPRS